MKTAKKRDVDLSGLRVLVVDDEADIRNGLSKLIGSLGASVTVAADGVEALEVVDAVGTDLVLTDLMMPRMTGAELLQAVKERSARTEVVVLTGYGTIQGAVSCLQSGASHFMTKPFDNQDVVTLVTRIGRQVLALRTANRSTAIIAEDPAMRSVLDLVDRVAASPLPVLIEGESGTGKEVIARAIHDRSAASSRPYLAVNAAALPDTLLESELFGHCRGSFTGADGDHAGLFQQAAGGSVFLDELCSMSPSFQGKLLRVLEEKTVRPLGGDALVPVNFRLISAANHDLEAMIRRSEFRDDLFYRVAVTRIHLPPLRERPADLVPLAMRFLEQGAATCLGEGAPIPRLTDEAVDVLRAHDWPGNVRELENVMNRALVTSTGDRIRAHHLGLSFSSWRPASEEKVEYAEGKRRAVERFQREFVQRALERTEGNVSRAAERCGLTRAALQRILRQLSIDPAAFRS